MNHKTCFYPPLCTFILSFSLYVLFLIFSISFWYCFHYKAFGCSLITMYNTLWSCLLCTLYILSIDLKYCIVLYCIDVALWTEQNIFNLTYTKYMHLVIQNIFIHDLTQIKHGYIKTLSKNVKLLCYILHRGWTISYITMIICMLNMYRIMVI